MTNARDLDPSAVARDFEEVWELSYRIKISDRFTVQPDLQQVRHPGGGSRQVADATVFLLRIASSY